MQLIIWGRTRMKLVNGQIQVAGDQWPIFLYANYTYDPEDPWNGLLHSGLLVSVSLSTWNSSIVKIILYWAFKHIFTSPSSVDQEPKATCSGNAWIHGMCTMTKASIAYVAMQVRLRHVHTVLVWYCLGMLCTHLCTSIFSHGSANRFRVLLFQSCWATWWPGGKGGGWSTNDMVESVSDMVWKIVHLEIWWTWSDKFSLSMEILNTWHPRTVLWQGFTKSGWKTRQDRALKRTSTIFLVSSTLVISIGIC